MPNFFKETEAVLGCNVFPVEEYPRVLVQQATSGTLRVWISESILEKSLTWAEAKVALATRLGVTFNLQKKELCRLC